MFLNTVVHGQPQVEAAFIATRGTTKHLYVSFFSISEEKLKDLNWGAKWNNKEKVWYADMMTYTCAFTQ